MLNTEPEAASLAACCQLLPRPGLVRLDSESERMLRRCLAVEGWPRSELDTGQQLEGCHRAAGWYRL